MRLRLRYFASLREALGGGEEVEWPVEAAVASVPAPDSTATAGALRAWLRTRSEAHAQALAPGRAVRVAVDQVLADESAALHDGAEVAFFPPVTGG